MKNKRKFKGSVMLNPVPVVAIGTRNKEGKDNVFTVAWVGTACTRPPMLTIAVRPERLSYEYLMDNKEFTVNIPNSKIINKIDYCGVKSGRTNNKIEEMGFTMTECDEINAAYIDECPITIECRVNQILELGSHNLVVADVLCSHINESIIDERGKIHFEKANLVSYCHGGYYKMGKEAIGTFGYSVMKKKNVKEEKVEQVKKEKSAKAKTRWRNKKK